MTTADNDEVDEVTIDAEAVTEITVDGDVVWEADTGSEPDPDVYTADTFAGGSFASGWLDTTGWEVVADANAVDGEAATRTGGTRDGNPLLADDTSFDYYPERDGRFVVWTWSNDASSGESYASLECNRGTNDRLVVDYDDSDNTAKIWHYDGTWGNAEASVDIGDSGGEYLTFVLHWGYEANVWVYDSADTELATVSTLDPTDGQSSTEWGFVHDLTNDQRVGDVEFHVTHPVTGEHYSEYHADDYTADSFIDGNFATEWVSTADWSAVADANAPDGFAAHRAGGDGASRLDAGSGNFDHDVEAGGRFVRLTARNSGANDIRGGLWFNEGASTSYTIELIGGGTLDVGTFDGARSTLGDASITNFDATEYYDIVFIWGDGAINADVYDDTGSHVATVDVADAGVTESTGWNGYSSIDDDTFRLGEVAFHDVHPYEGIHYTDWEFDTGSSGGGGGGTDGETFALDYDAAASLEDPPDSYDLVEMRNGDAGLTTTGPTPPGDSNTASWQFVPDGHPENSTNTLIEFDQRVGGFPQEVYFEVDVHLTDVPLEGTNTLRIYWNMNRAGSNIYNSNEGDGWSNALGVTPRQNPPSGHYHFFTYNYDSRGGGTSGNQRFEVRPAEPVPIGEWWTLAGYVKCSDPGQHNAHQKYWVNGVQVCHDSGYLNANAEDAWCHQFGPLGYFHESSHSSLGSKEYHFANTKYWVDDDIPSEFRE